MTDGSPEAAHAAPSDPTLAAITEARTIWRTVDSPFRALMLMALNRHDSKHRQSLLREEKERNVLRMTEDDMLDELAPLRHIFRRHRGES